MLSCVSDSDENSLMAAGHSDYPDSDIVLRSSDSRDFRVLKVFIDKSSPVLAS
jgi:hypothetical protein